MLYPKYKKKRESINLKQPNIKESWVKNDKEILNLIREKMFCLLLGETMPERLFFEFQT